MGAFATLLTANGYAESAANAMAEATLGSTPADARERISAIAYNYYMQFLAIQLSRFGFELNKPRLKPEELVEAEAYIDGRMGNEPLDNPKLTALLASLINDVLARHHAEPMTWENFYFYEYDAGDNIVLRGEDMVKALIKSNALHYGTRADIYHHSFNEVEYKTLSMHHLAARILSAHTQTLAGVNTYGIAVQEKDVARIREVVSTINTMRDPELRGFFQQNAHHNIKQKLALVFKELLGEHTDLHTLYRLSIELARSNFNPAMYNPEWRALLYRMQEGLHWISTPYIKRPTSQLAAH